MAKRAVVLGASGQIGQAAALALHADGWEVDLADRGNQELLPAVSALGMRRLRVDRAEPGALAVAVGAGAELLVDVVAFGAVDARQLLDLGDRVGAIVAISTVSVYADAQGRTLDEAEELGFPSYDVPLREDGPLVAAADTTYSHRKVAMEQVLREQDRVPVTILRPGAVHGPGVRHAREWWVVKRALDGRRVMLLNHGGKFCFQTTSAANLGELVRLAAARPGHRVLNACDPETLTCEQVCRAVAAASGWDPQVRLLGGAGPVGESPWSVPADVTVDMTAARTDLGYEAVTTYAESVGATVDWLVATVGGRSDWAQVLTGLMPYGDTLFDYAAEDAWLSANP